MPRDVPHWYGKRNEPVPVRVRIRVFERFDGVCQCGCGIKIAGKPWQCDHVVALINYGLNAESNLQPILASCHKTKTREDVAVKSKTARVKALNIGIKKAKRPMPGSRASNLKKCLDGRVVRRDTGELA